MDSLPAAAAEKAQFGLLSYDPGVGIWAIVAFSILLIVMRKYAWNPILQSIDEREKRLQDAMEMAENARQESRRIAEEHKRTIAIAREEAHRIIDEARVHGEELRERLQVTAEEEKEKLLHSAQVEIEILKKAAMAELLQISGKLAVEAAQRLVRDHLDDQRAEQLVRDCIEEFTPR